MSHNILDHWSHQRQIPGNLICSIDWEASAAASKSLGLNRSLWIPKWLAGFAPVGKVLQRFHFQEHAECPRCVAFEDTAHVLTCHAPRATTQWDASISKLDIWLRKSKTLPDLCRPIVSKLRAWRNNKEIRAPSYGPDGLELLSCSKIKLKLGDAHFGGVYSQKLGSKATGVLYVASTTKYRESVDLNSY